MELSLPSGAAGDRFSQTSPMSAAENTEARYISKIVKLLLASSVYINMGDQFGCTTLSMLFIIVVWQVLKYC